MLEVDLYVSILCQLIDSQKKTYSITKELMLKGLTNMHLYTCTIETYINVWTLLAKV
jgi:hypothetical protein